MIRFRLFGIPVTIEWMFWLIGVLFGFHFFTQPGREGLIIAVIWMAVWLGSFLIHEMGHALTYRKFGGHDARIHLYGFGGYATASGYYTRGQRFLITAAGPLVEIAAGLVAMLILRESDFSSQYLKVFLYLFSFICIFWGLFNLIPVYPLDGGQIVDAVLGKGMVVTAKVSVVAGIIAAVVLFTVFNLKIAAFFIGYLAFKNWQRLQGREG
jgi:Zn-dependent protease